MQNTELSKVLELFEYCCLVSKSKETIVGYAFYIYLFSTWVLVLMIC